MDFSLLPTPQGTYVIPSRDVYLPLYECLFVGICSVRQAASVSAPAVYDRGAANSAGSTASPSSSVITTSQPSLTQTRAFATATSLLERSHLTVSSSFAATIRYATTNSLK
jgi:hypothetical protein